MKRYISDLKLLLPALLAALILGAVSCNEKDDDLPKGETTQSVAVNKFTLEANTKVLSRLDSVFFSIDLEHGVIFNADSLPMGTDVSSLVAKITYPSTVTSATIAMTGGSKREGTFSYSDKPTDSIDFTGKVVLTLWADNGNVSKQYRIKVNVHNSNPDSIMWDRIAVSKLPSRMVSPRAQKTLQHGNGMIALIEEADGSFTRSVTDSPSEAVWDKKVVNFSFVPRVSTFSHCGDKFYILATDGQLMESDDALAWHPTGSSWDNIIGDFGTTLLGLRTSEGTVLHAYYPQSPEFEETAIEEGFPVKDYSNIGKFASAWSPEPMAFIVGGKDADGRNVCSTWAFDGSRWAEISNKSMPPRLMPTIIPYFAYLSSTSGMWTQTRYSVWLCLGGITADGEISPDVYISYDNGVNWDKASQLMQLPEYIPALYGADAIVIESDMNANLADNWTRMSSPRLKGANVSYTIDGTNVNWECPYIYLVGGISTDGALNSEIYRAVLARLTFPPLF